MLPHKISYSTLWFGSENMPPPAIAVPPPSVMKLLEPRLEPHVRHTQPVWIRRIPCKFNVSPSKFDGPGLSGGGQAARARAGAEAEAGAEVGV